MSAMTAYCMGRRVPQEVTGVALTDDAREASLWTMVVLVRVVLATYRRNGLWRGSQWYPGNGTQPAGGGRCREPGSGGGQVSRCCGW